MSDWLSYVFYWQSLNIISIFWITSSNDLNKISLDYLTMPQEKAANGDVPLMFITFPSARDPTYHDRYPGMFCYQ